MTTAITGRLLHDLVAGTHAEGITALAVEATIERDDRTLLIAEDGAGITDVSWRLPGGPVLPGQTLAGALHVTIAGIGLNIDQITGYLGHHDHAGAQTTRAFRFAVTVTDPDVICQHAGTGHRWAATQDDLPGLTTVRSVRDHARGRATTARRAAAGLGPRDLPRRSRSRAAHQPRHVPAPRRLHRPLHQHHHQQRRHRPRRRRLVRRDHRPAGRPALLRRGAADAPPGS